MKASEITEGNTRAAVDKIHPFLIRMCYIRNRTLFLFLLKIVYAEKLGSNAFITDPDRYWKAEEKERKSFVGIAGPNSGHPEKLFPNKQIL